MLELAVIIVNYNTRDLLRQALESVRRAADSTRDRLHVQTLVVDNGSADGSAEMVASEFPEVHLIDAGRNLGFTAANNLALARLGLVQGESDPALHTPEYILLLNPDAEVSGEAVLTLVDFMQSRPDVGICGPKLQYGDGAFQHGAFAFPGVVQVALDLFPVGKLPGAHRLYAGRANGRYPQSAWNGGTPFPVDFVLGAAMLVRAEMVRVIGGLDEGYFMYCEEMDWALRAHQAGWAVCAVPRATVIHHEAQSSKQVRWQSWRRLWESRLRFYALHADAFPPGTNQAVRLLVRSAMRVQTASARRRFARGKINGLAAAEELEARRAILAAARAS